MAELDHIVYACRDVADGSRYIEELTGAIAVVGGQHVGRGTHNALLTFDDHTYFEIIGIDPSQPEPNRPRGFGLDELGAPKLVAYAIHTVGDETLLDLGETVRSAGFDPGVSLAMSREKPDGELLEWELTTGGDNRPCARWRTSVRHRLARPPESRELASLDGKSDQACGTEP